MTDDSLSALFDGELTGPELDRLLADVERSPEMGRQWSRLCAAREAQEGTRIGGGQRCICAGVMDNLDAEPAAAVADVAAEPPKVVDIAVRRARRPGFARVWKPALGFAAAASMGAAAVLISRPVTQVIAPSAGGGNVPMVRYDAPDPAYRNMVRVLWAEHNNSMADEGYGQGFGDVRYVVHYAGDSPVEAR